MAAHLQQFSWRRKIFLPPIMRIFFLSLRGGATDVAMAFAMMLGTESASGGKVATGAAVAIGTETGVAMTTFGAAGCGKPGIKK